MHGSTTSREFLTALLQKCYSSQPGEGRSYPLCLYLVGSTARYQQLSWLLTGSHYRKDKCKVYVNLSVCISGSKKQRNFTVKVEELQGRRRFLRVEAKGAGRHQLYCYILPYRLGFLLLSYIIHFMQSNQISAGNIERTLKDEDMAQLEEQELSFFIHSIIRQQVDTEELEENSLPRGGYNLRAYMAQVSSDFIATVILYLYDIDNILKSKNVKIVGGEVEKILINILKEYVDNEHQRNRNAKNSGFLTPLFAYLKLYKSRNKLLKNVLRSKLKVIVEEEAFARIEPIFQEIAKKFKASSGSNGRKRQLPTKKILEFLTSVDEVESIACFIEYLKEKQLNTSNKNDGHPPQVVIVPCNQDTWELLRFALWKKGLIRMVRIRMAQLPQYRVMYAFLALSAMVAGYEHLPNFPRVYDYIGDLFTSPASILSKYRLHESIFKDIKNVWGWHKKDRKDASEQTSRWREDIINILLNVLERESKKKRKEKPLKEICDWFKNLRNSSEEPDLLKWIEQAKHFSKLKSTGRESVPAEMRVVVRKLLNLIEEQIREGTIAEIGELLSLLDMAGSWEKDVLAPAPDAQNKSLHNLVHVYLVPPHDAFTLQSDYLIVCGLTSKFDRFSSPPIPFSILQMFENNKQAKSLDPIQEKVSVVEKLQRAMEHTRRLVWLSYAPYGMSSRDVQGVSLFLEALKDRGDVYVVTTKPLQFPEFCAGISKYIGDVG